MSKATRDYDLETMARELIRVCELPLGCGGTVRATLRDAYEMGRDGISYHELREQQKHDLLRFARFEGLI